VTGSDEAISAVLSAAVMADMLGQPAFVVFHEFGGPLEVQCPYERGYVAEKVWPTKDWRNLVEEYDI
jgi:hypothetical protein